MRDYGRVPTVITCSALISACVKGDKAAGASDFSQAMRDQGLVPDGINPVLVSRGTASSGPGWVPPAAPGGLWLFAGGWTKRATRQKGPWD